MTDSTALATRNSDELRVFSLDGFDAAQRMAKALASSTLVPKIYQGQEGLPNCLIALELSSRMRISVMVVMQNMVPIQGRPSWSSQFLIGTVNACGKFSPLRYIFDSEDEPTSCYCEAQDLASGEILRGEKITIAMAKAEGWHGRNGSKWQTMPGQMLRYRAASWWQRAYCPELTLGLPTQEEAIDVEAVTVSEVPAAAIAPAVPEPLTHRAEESAKAATPATESTPAPGPQPAEPEPEPGAASRPAPIDSLATPSGPEPAAPATSTPAAARPAARPLVRRAAPAVPPAPDAPIPGLD